MTAQLVVQVQSVVLLEEVWRVVSSPQQQQQFITFINVIPHTGGLLKHLTHAQKDGPIEAWEQGSQCFKSTTVNSDLRPFPLYTCWQVAQVTETSLHLTISCSTVLMVPHQMQKMLSVLHSEPTLTPQRLLACLLKMIFQRSASSYSFPLAFSREYHSLTDSWKQIVYHCRIVFSFSDSFPLALSEHPGMPLESAWWSS